MTMLRRMRTWAALLLTVILAHALLPIAPPTVMTSGSPFSASTLEVSTAPTRKAPVTEQRQTLNDPADAADLASLPAFPFSVRLPAPSALPMVRGPPAFPPAPDEAYPAGASGSRAPPLS